MIKLLEHLGDWFADFMLTPIRVGASIFLALYTLGWGVWLAMPWDTFSRATVYNAMDVFPEWSWGLAAIICAGVSLWSIYKHMPRTIFTCAAVTAWFWMIISIALLVGDWRGLTGIEAAMMCIFSLYVYLNGKINLQDAGG